MILARELDTGRVTKVKGHATLMWSWVECGRLDRLGSVEADTAADLGWIRQSEAVMDIIRVLVDARELWYPIGQQHHSMIAISLVSVDHEERSGTAPDPLFGIRGVGLSSAKVDIRIDVDLAALLGPLGFLCGPWVQVSGGCITGADVAAWPNSVSLLREFFILSGYTLHWPADTLDLEHCGVSYLEVLFSLTIGLPVCSVRRLLVLMYVLTALFLFLRCLFRKELTFDRSAASSAVLSGRLGRFLPCVVGRHLSRLCHFVWEQCSHGLASRPLESCHHQCLKAVRYPAGAAAELLMGHKSPSLHHTVFWTFSPWSLHGVVRAVPRGASGKRCGHATADLSDECSILVRRLWLTWKACPGYPLHSRPDSGLPTPK